jgi:dihydroorotate dehydrogenase
MIYRSLLRPLLFRLPPESVHEWVLHTLPLTTGTRTIRNLIARRNRRSPFGELKRFGLTFSNPVVAAGFDKNGVALEALAALGFGHLEAGTVTYRSQPGNPKPRLFRLPEDQALINRAGFNNDGAEAFTARVSKRRPDCILGVSIGKSKAAPLTDAVTDYLKSFATVFPVADYVAVNVSSPNTPGLRNLQQANELEALLTALQQKNDELVQAHTKLLTPNRSVGQACALLVSWR